MENKLILALGFFDGVHVGHQALLAACRALAKQAECAAGVVTFTSHPLALIAGQAPGLLNTLEDRVRLLKALGPMDNVICLPFDRAMMTMPWQDFFRLLCTRYHAAGLICGQNFRFGNRGEGTSLSLQAACRAAKLPCIVVPEQRVDGVAVSSTRIRELLEAGQMAQAVRFLGHPHILTGTVVPGRHLGRTLGIPTANLALPEGLLSPRLGVYACMASCGDVHRPAVVNVGTRPTVDGRDIRAEAWLPDYSGDLYGQSMTLEFYHFLRPERKFASLPLLQAEIHRNARQTLEFFEKSGKFSFTFG